MLKSHEKFHSANGKRLVLVVDDEYINRALLENILNRDYEVLSASNGAEALALIREKKELLSLILLDLIMPEIHGLTLLQMLKSESDLQEIPVIVMTADRDSEVECLRAGANDFIAKPFNQPEVILARVLRTIELSEDRQIIRHTERDSLTGLYNREYFYRYAEQFDQHHRDMEMDAMLVDVNHFRLINERYGKACGDEVLRRIGERLREAVRDAGGIVCRREADTFLIYCPHGISYPDILERASIGLAGETAAGNSRIRLRMGVYPQVDKGIDVERRFDRAKLAADSVHANYSQAIGYYDSKLHEKEIYTEQLLEDFETAIAERQFKVFYQPKFDIRPDIPVLSSAEALVRWLHPTLGMISPGVFIPLFEENGLIPQLDSYVWRETAAQICAWKERFGISVPVSVNVSRVDMYDANLVENFRSLMEEYSLSPEEYLLEITESAYTQDSDQIIGAVKQLRELGFHIEMDDFGTGYSSLNMISTLPIDALKLDMKFIRNAFNDRRDIRMIEVIIDIAEYLAVPVIAEGVETAEQLNVLKAMGCDIVQGYFFSKPVPQEEFERFVRERRERGTVTIPQGEADEANAAGTVPYYNIAHALSSSFESIYYVDSDSGHYVEFSSQGRYESLQIERSGADFFGDTQRNIPRVVYRDDQERVSACMQKEALMTRLTRKAHFSITYRLVIDGTPQYYNLKVIRASGRDGHHIVVGVSNVDNLVRQSNAQELSLKDPEFFSIAQALADDFDSIYYVDTDTNRYSEFTRPGAYEKLELEILGEDFFAETQKNLPRAIFEEDLARVSAALRKEALLAALAADGVFTMEYRLVINGEPVYHRLRAVPAGKDDSGHIVIGVRNIASEIEQEREYAAARQNSLTFSQIAQALARDYFSVYYVDIQTDAYEEYCSEEARQAMALSTTGKHFFEETLRNIPRIVYEEDREKALEVWQKENMLRALEKSDTFSATYRLVLKDEPVYVSLKVTRLTDQDRQHIVVGVSNVDAQMKREQELNAALALAIIDPLTHVKNKRAYAQAEQKLNREIAEGIVEPFAIAMCDLNGLKTINDTHGHKEGDRCIQEACSIVCHVFAHSPVYRVGGDEFVAILRGQDYENRAALLEQMAARNRENEAAGKVLVSCGLAEFDPVRDTALAGVFERADAAMYQKKMELKNAAR